MPRVARIIVPGFPHHVTQRGNRQGNVFMDEADRQKYLMLLMDYKQRYGLSIWAWCLMSNHVHFVAVPAAADSLARTMRDTHQAYSVYVNRRLEQSGHLWQGRFYSTAMDEQHLWAAVAYVERNPVRANMVQRAEDYPWSSAAGHCGLRHDAIISRDWPPKGAVADWSAWLAQSPPKEQTDSIRKLTLTGRPCGQPSFVEQLEKLLSRELKPKKRGRKPRNEEGLKEGQIP